MKKAFAFMAFVMMLTACDKETYRHAISVLRPSSGRYGVAYADQPSDSIVFSTFDSYRAIVGSAPWLTIDPQMAQCEIPNNYWYCWEVVLPLDLQPNTSGETRDAVVSINTYGADDWNQTVQVGYLQLGWLNVTRPVANVGTYTSFPRKADFLLTDSATQVADSLVFSVYGDWSVSTTSTFIHLAQTEGVKGNNVVHFTLDVNEDTSDRNDTIKLTSRGVTTPIAIKQTGKKE